MHAGDHFLAGVAAFLEVHPGGDVVIEHLGQEQVFCARVDHAFAGVYVGLQPAVGAGGSAACGEALPGLLGVALLHDHEGMIRKGVAQPKALIGLGTVAVIRRLGRQITGQPQYHEILIHVEFHLGAQAVFHQCLDYRLTQIGGAEQQVVVAVTGNAYADQTASFQSQVHAGAVALLIHLAQIAGHLTLQIMASLLTMGADHGQVVTMAQIGRLGTVGQDLGGDKIGPAHGAPVERNDTKSREIMGHDR